MKTIRLLFALLLLSAMAVKAQTDSLKIDLTQAERLFLTKNYQLLAANYQISQAQAEIITAKLFDNPELSYENLFYNHETKRFFETSFATGQYNAQISQLIKLAGKRKKNIALAETGVKMATHEYADLLRNLRFQLRNTFYKAYYSSQSIQVYRQEITSSEQLLNIYQQQFKMGNVASKDVIRIQSLLINLKSELNSLLNELEDNYKDIKLMCGIEANTKLYLSLNPNQGLGNEVQKTPYVNLLDSAKANRSDYQLAKTGLSYNEANLKLQKAMAIPDVELSLSYDLKGNYPEKYTGIGIRVPIPLFNRNQGEIKKAKIGIEAASTHIQMQEALLANEVYNSYQTALRSEQQYKSIDPQFSNSFDQLMVGVNKNFRERNISLIEFLDFYQSYKESTLQLNQLKFERLSNREEINYVTGSNIFN
ncbi:TolC family protein [Pedobacter sp. Hv1]|uniref:TolC family protein n=1 Tax=Pedobacter sp. Hv1 TaxID=1740090 RepID=UPI0006D8B3FA|nr:TolC family protein [Pedobacter sp. Hv1]KQC00731.1 cation transporter [Pedobacter sp. Hv1]